MIRLHKYIAESGICSRRRAEKLIIDGKVKVNEEVITRMGVCIDPAKDKVKVEGKLLRRRKDFVYILLNKPKGYISTVSDPHGRRTVLDLIKIKQRIFPVGRLDYDTTGLLLLTDDGDTSNKLMHPKYEIKKVYEAIVAGNLNQLKLAKLRKGIDVGEFKSSPSQIKIISENNSEYKIHVCIHEGRKRQVRRMFEAVGCKVIELKRIRYAFLTLKGLKPGQYRYLDKQEIKRLKNLKICPKG